MSGADPLPAAHVVHAVPGRTRLIVPSRRGDAAFFAAATVQLGEAPGVAAVRANPRAGSLVARHAGGADAVAAAAREAGLFEVAPLPAEVAPSAPARLHPQPRKVQPLMLAACGLAGLGVVQALRGRVAGNGVGMLWHAYQARQRFGMPGLSHLLVVLGLVQLARGQALGSAASLLFYALSARELAREERAGGWSGSQSANRSIASDPTAAPATDATTAMHAQGDRG